MTRNADGTYRPTMAIEAYEQGFLARLENPEAASWQGIMPYSVSPLTHSWIDGWRDAVGDYHWWPGGVGPPVAVEWCVPGGRCPHCSNYPLRRKSNGELWCIQYPCSRICLRPNNGVEHLRGSLIVKWCPSNGRGE